LALAAGVEGVISVTRESPRGGRRAGGAIAYGLAAAMRGAVRATKPREDEGL